MFEGMTFGSVVEAIYGNLWVRGALALIAADVLSGIALSLYSKDFRLAQTGEFLLTRAIPYLLGGGTLQLVLFATPPEWNIVTSAASGAVWLFVIASLAGHFLDNLKQMGLPIPTVLTTKAKIDTKTGT